jgi:hypothetical protein
VVVMGWDGMGWDGTGLAERCLCAPCLRGLSEGEGTGGQAAGQSQDARWFYEFAWTGVDVDVVSACLGRLRPLPILLVISLGLMGEGGIGCGQGLMVESKRG